MTSRADRPDPAEGLGGLGPEASLSLVDELGETVDQLRQLQAEFGLRPYRYYVVMVRWSGGSLGRGEPEVVREVELVPPPRIVERRLRREMLAAGYVERGMLQLEQLSPRYTEDDLESLFPRELAAGEEVWIEERIDARDGETRRRRFVPDAAPERDAGGFQWRLRLRPQDDGRDRRGRPAVPRWP